MNKIILLVFFALVSISFCQIPINRNNTVVFFTTNKCQFPVWVGFTGQSQSNPNFASNLPYNGGWLLNSRQTVPLSVPGDLEKSRLWGRTNCRTGENGIFSCETGNCADNVQCAFDGIQRSIFI